jgi:hypothetical protein
LQHQLEESNQALDTLDAELDQGQDFQVISIGENSEDEPM